MNGPQYGAFQIDIFDEWLRHDVGRIFVQGFDEALAGWSGQPHGLCVNEETCGSNLAMEFNGDLYACDHFVEPRYFLGNIAERPLAELAMSPDQHRFGQNKKTSLPAYCQDCEVRFICNGGCPKDRLLKSPDGERNLNYLCAGYRAFFNYIRPPMRMMAALLQAKRAPAEVMQLISGQSGLRGTPDGAACPCGSGKPVEQCHRAPGGYVPPNHTSPPPSQIQAARRRH